MMGIWKCIICSLDEDEEQIRGKIDECSFWGHYSQKEYWQNKLRNYEPKNCSKCKLEEKIKKD